MSSDIAIKVEGLSKSYQIYGQPRDRLKQFVLPHLQGFLKQSPKKYYREFWALQDVSFEIKKGETIGIVGRNGSGKSTLLQMICGTLNPTSGHIATYGRISALLELGSGFNPEFTGRENVYMNGAILGLSNEKIDLLYEKIIAFADIGEFVEQPVKTYSSGMIVRLAFSVAIHVEPDILIVDEALAVGDFQFQSKCYEKIKSIRDKGATVLFVSHDLSAVSQFCDRGILLSNGHMLAIGPTSSIINKFKDLCYGATESSDTVSPQNQEPTRLSITDAPLCEYYSTQGLHRSGSGEVKIIDWGIITTNPRQPVASVEFSENATILLWAQANKAGVNPNIGFFFTDVRGNELVGAALNHEGVSIGPMKDKSVIQIAISFRISLKPGRYFLNLGCSEIVDGDLIVYDRLYSLTEIIVTGKKDMVGYTSLFPNFEINFL